MGKRQNLGTFCRGLPAFRQIVLVIGSVPSTFFYRDKVTVERTRDTECQSSAPKPSDLFQVPAKKKKGEQDDKGGWCPEAAQRKRRN